MAEKQRIIDRFYRTIIDSVYDMIYLHDLKGNIIDVNQKALENIGYTRDELLNMQVFDLHPESDKEIYHEDKIKETWASCDVGESVDFEVEHISKDGTATPVEINTGKVSENGQQYMLAFVRDISERKEQQAEIEYMSYHDSLTDLYNRRYLEEEFKNIGKHPLPISIIMGDLNGLKIINNSYGHSKGDKVLIKAAEILQEITPEKAVLGRFGGDEFVIILPDTDYTEGHDIMDRIKDKCQQTEKDNCPVSIGLGLATKTEATQDINSVLEKADKEMNQDKLLETKSANNRIVKSLLGALAAKSDETFAHTKRMTELAQIIGSKLGIHNSELNRLSLLATLHDIGKTAIPGEVLQKPGKLYKEEWQMIKKHPALGYKIAMATSEFAIVAEEILSHHEKWDGSGYPRGLQGDEIPYLARIISLVDAFDVMVTGRPYQKSKSKEEALKEIELCAGKQFDPEIAREFVELMRRGNL